MFGGRLKARFAADFGGLFEKIGVDIAEACAAGADFFLHAHQMAEKQFLIFGGLLFGQRFDFRRHRAYAFHAREKHRREHMFGVFAHGGADEGGQFGGNAFRRPVARERVHHAFGRQRAFGKTRPLQIFGGAALHGFKHGVAEQVVAAFFAVHHQVVGIEMKAHMRRKIRQPKHRSLQACRLPRRNRFVQRRLPRMLVGEFADIEFQAERFAGVFDDAARRNAVRHQRHTGELD